jgi:hypothetical protein
MVKCAKWLQNQFELVGENMVKYSKKVDEKISSLKRGNFSQKHKKLNSKFT